MNTEYFASANKLLADVGEACSAYLDKAMVNLPCKRVQIIEIWSFVGIAQKNVPAEKADSGRRDTWTWIAIDAETKLVPTRCVGHRNVITAIHSMEDVAKRLANRVKITMDGLKADWEAVPLAFDNDVDYAMLVKTYGPMPTGAGRNSPSDCIGAKKDPKIGNPDDAHISTSFVEHQNLTIRMRTRVGSRG